MRQVTDLTSGDERGKIKATLRNVVKMFVAFIYCTLLYFTHLLLVLFVFLFSV